MAETFLFGLAEWSLRAAALAGTVGALLWMLRVKDVHARLTAWTIVLAASLMMPVAIPLMPRFSVTVPRLPGHQRSRPAIAPLALPLQVRNTHFADSPGEANRPAWTDLAAGTWLIVALAMLFRLAIGLRLSARMVRGSRLVEDGVRESDWVRVPVTVGIIRPVIVLPADWREWPASKLNAVLAHERGHVSRRDPLRQFAASIYRSAAWFHPLSWWLRDRLAELAEEASDDVAIAASEDREKYAEMLLSFIERTPQRVEWEGVTMANRRTRMLRIDRVLDHTRRLSRPSSRAAAALVVAALPLIYVSTATQPVLAQDPAATPAPQDAIDSKTMCGGNPMFAKWANEDVAYIITREERAALGRLNTQPECSMFVEQFWLRRDPTPSTPQNEFKDEHYRRIAYANAHFASARNPGWRTDRGRVYITYGPPDEIEFHPKGGDQGRADPFDQWLYHHVDAASHDILFDFVDTSRDNEFRLAFMGGLADKREAGGPVVFGPIGQLYVQVNIDRTLFITTPVRGASAPVYGKILDRTGALIQTFEDLTHAAMYGKQISKPLPAGQYTLNLKVGLENRSIVFEVK